MKSGQLSRIAIDEAHTLVQWGDHFRPAFRRLEPVISELRVRAQAAGHQLSICALTATANRSVKEDLLKGIFSAPSHDAPHIVAANPIRPEIAVYSRQLTTGGGDLGISSIAEAVADRAPGHLIIYCLTINEVQTTYAQLREWIGAERAWQVQRFHGRLTEAEKSAVLNAFKSAPKLGEEGYYRMIIVATSAFGLGVDRPDVAAVLCLSPPADLAALYQQLGRAGRGLAQGTENEKIGAVGMALAHRRGWNMVEFLTTTDLPSDVLCDLGRRVLRSDGLVDARALANTAIDEEVAAGRMSEALAVRSRTRVEYRAGVIRAIAALSQLSAVADHGDLPNKVRVMRGTFQPDDKKDRFFIEAVVNGVASLRTEGAVGIAAVTCRLPDLHAALASVGGVDALDGPAETWVRLLGRARRDGWTCRSSPPTKAGSAHWTSKPMNCRPISKSWSPSEGSEPWTTSAHCGRGSQPRARVPSRVLRTTLRSTSRALCPRQPHAGVRVAGSRKKGAATRRRRPSCSVPSGSLDPDL